MPVLTELIQEPVPEGVSAEQLAELERRLADQITVQVHSAVEEALAKLRAELGPAIEDAVIRALARRPVK